jgi:hypothetical protein
MATNSTTHLMAAMPNPGLAHSFLDKHIASPFASSGKHTAILPIMLSDNANARLAQLTPLL